MVSYIPLEEEGMADHRLFFLDADGWFAGPESAPFPVDARTLDAALVARHNAATGSDLGAALLSAEPDRHRPRAPVTQYGAA